jgi:hypothetical protein
VRTPSDTSLLHQWGRHRPDRRHVVPRWIWFVVGGMLVVAFVAAVWIRERPHAPWRPPSGAPSFSKCDYGGELAAWCGRVAVPEDPSRPTGRTISLRLTVVPATATRAKGALFYLEGGPGGAASASAIRRSASTSGSRGSGGRATS